MEDDDIPFADPIIRARYEAALGRFILIYNEVDYRLSHLIARDLDARQLSEMKSVATDGTFLRRLEVFAALASTPKSRLSGIPIPRLKQLNADRNSLAHGHFDQNPFDGSYSLALARKFRDYPIEQISAFADELSEIAEALRYAEVHYDFGNLSLDELNDQEQDKST